MLTAQPDPGREAHNPQTQDPDTGRAEDGEGQPGLMARGEDEYAARIWVRMAEGKSGVPV